MLTLRSVPTYEYECPKCPRVCEVKQRISEPAFTTCDRCGGPIHRLLNATPFILKGGGWYVTDYPSESRKKALSSESGGNSSPSESKPGTGEGTSSSSSPSSGDSGASGEAAKSTPKPSVPAKSSGTE